MEKNMPSDVRSTYSTGKRPIDVRSVEPPAMTSAATRSSSGRLMANRTGNGMSETDDEEGEGEDRRDDEPSHHVTERHPPSCRPECAEKEAEATSNEMPGR